MVVHSDCSAARVSLRIAKVPDSVTLVYVICIFIYIYIFVRLVLNFKGCCVTVSQPRSNSRLSPCSPARLSGCVVLSECFACECDTTPRPASRTPPPFIICTSRQDSPVSRQLATSSDEMKSVLFHSHTCTHRRTDPRLPFAAGVNINMLCLFARGADAHNLPALFALALPKHSCLRSQFMRPDQGLN